MNALWFWDGEFMPDGWRYIPDVQYGWHVAYLVRRLAYLVQRQ